MWLFVGDTQPTKIFVGDTAISKVFLGDQQVRPSGWQPWANTLLYLPLNTTDTYTDKSWNSRTVTNYGIQFWTYSWVDCAYFDNGSGDALVLGNFTLPSDLTVSWWQYQTQVPTDTDGKTFQFEASSDAIFVGYTKWTSPQGLTFETKKNGTTATKTTWVNLTWKRVYCNFTSNSSGSTLTTIDNGTTQTWTNTWWHRSFTPTKMWLWNYPWRSPNRRRVGYMSEFIMESTGWSATDITNYYNQTKATYWIS